MIAHGVEHGLRYLRPGSVVEEDKSARPLERRKQPAKIVDRKRRVFWRWRA
jgi:hypothetical protein